MQSDGRYGIIETVEIERLSEPEATYNFEVAEYHTYYVGSGILTHNKCVAKEGSYRTDVRVGGDPNHSVGHAHIYHGYDDIASISADGTIFAGRLNQNAKKFVRKYFDQISAGIQKYYYIGK